MKISCTGILLFSLAATAWVFSSRLRPVEAVRMMEEHRSLEEPTRSIPPATSARLQLQVVETPVAVAEPKRPVQLIEERGDALFFEISALVGMPFDQAITLPFD